MTSHVDESGHQTEVSGGDRFEFGKNWRSFLDSLSDDRIAVAEHSLQETLGLSGSSDLLGKTFLDIGSGSGLFSLAARKMGAKAYSFDYDPISVACTVELRSKYFPDESEWIVKEGSVLDRCFLKGLDFFDVVYAYGSLHHTGDMWTALANAASLAKSGGLLHVAIYNDQGLRSKVWRRVKQHYCSSTLGRAMVNSVFIPYFFARACIASVLRGQNQFAEYRRRRGMSITHDWRDWLGGLPYEVASADEIVSFFLERGFRIKNLKTTKSLGNNEFTFVRDPAISSD